MFPLLFVFLRTASVEAKLQRGEGRLREPWRTASAVGPLRRTEGGGGGNRTHGRLFRPSEVSNLLQCRYATPPNSLKLHIQYYI
jgi:hypothetical protein